MNLLQEKTHKFCVINDSFAIRKNGDRSPWQEITFSFEVDGTMNLLVLVAQER